jgi:hypothetical protein
VAHARRARTVEDSLGPVDVATPSGPPARPAPAVPLTDQARVAVHVAESLAGGAPTVGHLVAGLAGEPEGRAGVLLRRRHGEVAPRLALHPAVAAPDLPRLDVAYVALPVVDRPSWTLELLAAALRVGGAALARLLDDCGVVVDDEPLDLPLPDPDGAEDDALPPETYGRMSLLPRGVDAEADLAVARTRATGGDSLELLGWLGADDATRTALRGAPAVPVDRVLARALLQDLGVGRGELVTAITHLTLRAALDR